MITAIMSTYNEIDYLPLKIQWCRSNGMNLYVCDNMSTDGTWEMLKKCKIPSHQYDTNEMFSESLMQKEIKLTLARLDPQWVLYMGCDLFFDIPPDYDNYDFIRFAYYSVKNTGEKPVMPFNPFYTYHYGGAWNKLNFLFRWSKDVVFRADEITIPGICLDDNNLCLNYGDTKPKEQREETKRRKEKAWANGESKGWGTHYKTGSRDGWIWDKEKLTDLQQTLYWPVIQKIASDCGL